MQLIETISGIRGVVGSGLTPERVIGYCAALAKMGQVQKLVIGRDSRPSGETLSDLAARALSWAGIEVVDLGIVPTPTVQLMVEDLNADAGIAVTASHNPFPWNGLKFIDRSGRFFNAAQMKQLLDLKGENSRPEYRGSGEFARIEKYGAALNDHIRNVLDIPWIDVERIRARKFKVVVDAVNGGASLFIPALLTELGCEVVPLYCVPDGLFPHTPEPLPANLTDLLEAVVAHKADLGMAIDPDGDRLAICDENGRYLSEEYTLVMAVKAVLSRVREKGALVVTNLSTTRAVDDMAALYEARVIRTAIGEINVSQTMAEQKATIGGEGNGGIILPDSHLGRDSLVGAALVLQFLVDGGESLSTLYDTLPRYKMSKKKMELGQLDPADVIRRLEDLHQQDDCDMTDGLKISHEKSWVHIRKSNTEPIIRIYSEAPDQAAADKLGDGIMTEVRSMYPEL